MDILTDIAKRDTAPAPTKLRTVRLWAIVYGAGHKTHRHVLPYARARRLVARAKRMGVDCYLSRVTRTGRVQA